MRIPLFVIRALFFLCSVGIGSYLAKVAGEPEHQLTYVLGAGAIAALVVVSEVFFSKSPIAIVSATVFGITIGFLVAWLFTGLIEVVAQPTPEVLNAIRLILTLVCCYYGITLILQTQDDFRFIVPYVEFSRELRGTRPWLIDTSALVDGRLPDLGTTGFIDAPMLVPRFVVDELHALADSDDRTKRARGRRGLDVLAALRDAGAPRGRGPRVEIIERAAPGEGVDKKLIALARDLGARIVTTDAGVAKVGELGDVAVLNLHDLAKALQARAVAGERLTLKLIKPGEGAEQGVGYLEDGTMVVVEKARAKVGHEVAVEVTGQIQTSAGRMFFARLVA